jgi:selenocysteine lyase/cysteine desulfurase
MQEFDALAKSLQPHYSRFNVSRRLLFTGHSHQAWPDVAFEGVQDYLRMVADQVDKKWGYAFEKTELMRNYLRDFYDDPTGKYCREQNTHVLLVSWLSALDLKNKPKIITTTGEFHSMYR